PSSSRRPRISHWRTPSAACAYSRRSTCRCLASSRTCRCMCARTAGMRSRFSESTGAGRWRRIITFRGRGRCVCRGAQAARPTRVGPPWWRSRTARRPRPITPLRVAWRLMSLFCRPTVPLPPPRWWRAKAEYMRRCLACLAAFLGVSGAAWGASRPEVVIDPGGVPPAALVSINGAVEAITRLAEDQDGGEVERLRRRAHDATVSALETQGYFSPVVTLEVGQDYAGETWDIIIEPGPRTLVRGVDLRFEGQVAGPDFEGRRNEAREAWPLGVGEIF